MMDIDALALKKIDNVATALKDLPEGSVARTRVEDGMVEVPVAEAIPYGHKFALKTIYAGKSVVKYGEIIGSATRTIAVGQHAHVQNIESNRGRGDRIKG
jgi:altronate dehydratase small subunit